MVSIHEIFQKTGVFPSDQPANQEQLATFCLFRQYAAIGLYLNLYSFYLQVSLDFLTMDNYHFR